MANTIFVLALFPVVIILLGLVYDFADAYTTHTRALNVAEQAARRGAQQLDTVALSRDNVHKLDTGMAMSAASSFLSSTAPPEVTGQSVGMGVDPVTGDETVVVSVNWVTSTDFLGIIGIGTMSGTAGPVSARIAVGINSEDP